MKKVFFFFFRGSYQIGDRGSRGNEEYIFGPDPDSGIFFFPPSLRFGFPDQRVIDVRAICLNRLLPNGDGSGRAGNRQVMARGRVTSTDAVVVVVVAVTVVVAGDCRGRRRSVAAVRRRSVLLPGHRERCCGALMAVGRAAGGAELLIE